MATRDACTAVAIPSEKEGMCRVPPLIITPGINSQGEAVQEEQEEGQDTLNRSVSSGGALLYKRGDAKRSSSQRAGGIS